MFYKDTIGPYSHIEDGVMAPALLTDTESQASLNIEPDTPVDRPKVTRSLQPPPRLEFSKPKDEFKRAFASMSALELSLEQTEEIGECDSPLARSSRDNFEQRRHNLRAAKIWRTQSMFQSPLDVFDHEGAAPAAVPYPLSQLETFSVAQDPFRRINNEVLCTALDGGYSHLYHRIVVVDCRFEYEYLGGHIAGAINASTRQQLEQVLLVQSKPTPNQQVLVVMHCEYSAYRGPLMAAHLRARDREMNEARYPELLYPDIVILDGGYSRFFERFGARCEPRNYVGMNDHKYQAACELEMDRFRENLRPSRSRQARARHTHSVSHGATLGKLSNELSGWFRTGFSGTRR